MTDKRKMLVEGYQARPKSGNTVGITQGYQPSSSAGKPSKPVQLPKGATSGVTVSKSTVKQ